MAFRNYMEDAIIEELGGVISSIPDTCGCERCREDMVAWSLNRLPPKYVVTPLGTLYTKLHQMKTQSMMDIVVMLTKAAEVVKKNPRH